MPVKLETDKIGQFLKRRKETELFLLAGCLPVAVKFPHSNSVSSWIKRVVNIMSDHSVLQAKLNPVSE